MKTPTFCLSAFLICTCAAGAQENSFLSPQKQTLLQEEKNRYEAEHEKLRTNWIAPLNLSGSYSYDKSAGGTESDTKRLSASISQDVFRSGGITYQINYADANRQVREIALDQEIAALNEQLFVALLTYHKKRYELEQSGKKIDNYDIEIFIKRHLYEAGKADITELNNALMNKSAELKNAASLEYDIARQRLEIAKLSDVNPDTYPLPRFTLAPQDEYLENRLDLRYARAQAQSLEHLYRVSETNYLPSLALNAGVGYQKYDPKTFSGGYDGEYYSAGATLSVPLTYNASATIQEARATYLKQAAEAADKKRETAASYAQSLELIESYRRYIGITERNLALYDDLIAATQAGADAGTKTGYDLQTVKNTKAIEEYTIRINELNIQLELAKLHFALNSSKEPQ
ncbi:MAG: TolC family protein [Campylobacterales bacterium]|nr:TolC family protein [Campylobacterales bacterium]